MNTFTKAVSIALSLISLAYLPSAAAETNTPSALHLQELGQPTPVSIDLGGLIRNVNVAIDLGGLIRN